MKLYDALRRMVLLRVDRYSRRPFYHAGGNGGVYGAQAEPIEMELRVLVHGPDAPEAVGVFMRAASSGAGGMLPDIPPLDALNDLLRRDHVGIVAAMRELSPDALARLAVALDSVQTGRLLIEYRSPADVAKIAELRSELSR